MDLRFFIICEFASNTDTGQLNIIGTIDALLAPAFPTSVPLMFCVAKVFLKPEEIGKAYKFKVEWTNEKGDVQGTPAISDVTPKNSNELGGYINLNFKFYMQPFPEAGLYTANLYLGDHILAKALLDLQGA